MKKNLLDRFTKYISYATTSDENSETYPSTPGQLVFGDFLVEELKKLGLQEVEKDQYGYVTATLPANCEDKQPVIGFISHFDTAPVQQKRVIKGDKAQLVARFLLFHLDGFVAAAAGL